jgi:hypothetical protein
MRLVMFALFSALLFSQSASIAQTSEDPSNGNLISEPSLADFDHASRTPGFSQVYDIVDQNGVAQNNRAPGIISAPYEVVDSNGDAAL